MIFLILGWIILLLIIIFNPYFAVNGVYLIPISLFMVELGINFGRTLED